MNLLLRPPLAHPGASQYVVSATASKPIPLREGALPIVITEGELKTLALWRAANQGAPSRPRFLPVGVSGVYNWRGTIGKTVARDGSRIDVKGAIPDLDWVVWAGRRIIIAYDADAVNKESVRIARSMLAAHLRCRGAFVGFLECDIAKGKGQPQFASSPRIARAAPMPRRLAAYTSVEGGFVIRGPSKRARLADESATLTALPAVLADGSMGHLPEF